MRSNSATGSSSSADVTWAEINPTIFGAVFESTLSTVMRRKNGMHYTTVKNIHRVADPLCLWALEHELDEIAAVQNLKTRNAKLIDFQKKLGELLFLDPACGSGNFLTETYLSLRRLENRAIALRQQGQGEFDLGDVIRVHIDQFYGIEIDGFAVSVAQTALWIAESQMMHETEQILHRKIDFLPLKRYAHIVKGNALRMDWNELPHFSYILGNPPFIGARNKSSEQAADVEEVFKGWKNAGNLDYVTCWYKKASDLMRGTSTTAAFVSTNSICQGESAALLWKPLFAEGVEIDFAWRTFVWDSEANEKAHVHVVIVGFSVNAEGRQKNAPLPFRSASRNPTDAKWLFSDDGSKIAARHINGYLVDADEVWIESRTRPLCAVPEMTAGNRPADGGHLILEAEEYDSFVKKEPRAIPYLFRETINPKSYVIVPKVSSERREYIPIGHAGEDVVASDLLFVIPDATLYHFGVLTSSVHMAWMRTVCGRLKSDYRYSAAIVYNNFPWPENVGRIGGAGVYPPRPRTGGGTVDVIERTAQAILDARALYPDSSLADLYDPLTMPPELRKAHAANDAAVMEAYGFAKTMTEAEIVAELFKRYAELTRR